MTPDEVATFQRCMSVGGVALFPADTVYGLACDADTDDAVARLYALKGRRPDKPAAVMFFSVDVAFAALPELGERTRAAFEALLPGGVSLLVPNPAGRFPLSGGGAVLGVRVPALPPAAAALGAVRWPVLQSSANVSGGPDAKEVAEVPEAIREGVDLLLDAGPLPGVPSTVVDLTHFEQTRDWKVVRDGMVPRDELRERLAGL